MSPYRALLLGCGGRGRIHADVYRDVPGVDLVAVCDRVQERREEFAKTFEVPAAYDDYEAALAEVKPDIVDAATLPLNRIWEVERAAAAGVKAMIIEKPLAIKPSELAALERITQETGIKIATNCQRRYFPQFRDQTIRNIIQEKIGDLYFVRASTKGNMMGMGPHIMDLILFFLGAAQPTAVWAMAHTINETSYQESHKAPESIMAQYWFPNDVRVLLDCTPDALGSPGETSFWMHLHFDFLGTKGRLYLTQNAGYWYQSEGMAEPIHGESSFMKQDWDAQRDFTQAMADWLDGGEPHLNRFELHKHAVAALLGAQKSVYAGTRIDLPTTYTDAEWETLRERLRGT